jgi:hypothetical protein
MREQFTDDNTRVSICRGPSFWSGGDQINDGLLPATLRTIVQQYVNERRDLCWGEALCDQRLQFVGQCVCQARRRQTLYGYAGKRRH